jgi:hypothetical protein
MIHAWNLHRSTPYRDRLVDAMVKAERYERDFGKPLSTTFDLLADVGAFNREHREAPITSAEILATGRREAHERSESAVPPQALRSDPQVALER